MSEIYKLSGFQQELDKAERFFSMHLTRQELRNRLAEIERLKSIIKEAREYIEELAEDSENYIGAIDRRRKVELLEILDKVEENK